MKTNTSLSDDLSAHSALSAVYKCLATSLKFYEQNGALPYTRNSAAARDSVSVPTQSHFPQPGADIPSPHFFQQQRFGSRSPWQTPASAPRSSAPGQRPGPRSGRCLREKGGGAALPGPTRTEARLGPSNAASSDASRQGLAAASREEGPRRPARRSGPLPPSRRGRPAARRGPRPLSETSGPPHRALTSVRSPLRPRRLNPGRRESAGSHSKPVRPGPCVCFLVQRARGGDFRSQSRVCGGGGGGAGSHGNAVCLATARAAGGNALSARARELLRPLNRLSCGVRRAAETWAGVVGLRALREAREAPRVPQLHSNWPLFCPPTNPQLSQSYLELLEQRRSEGRGP